MRSVWRGWLLAAFVPATLQALDATSLYQAWPAERFVTTPAPCLRPVDLGKLLDTLVAKHPELSLREVGRSVGGRPIRLLSLGHGDRGVLLWSQMHGDEPSATPALLDLADYFLRHREDPEVATLLDRLTLHFVPMLNPDGAAAYTRRNAQGIDINRDALNLTTPEGRVLKRLREELHPVLGFNLHDQNRRRSVGDTGVLATNAVLAVTGDAEGTMTPGRLLAKRAGAAVAAALAPFAPGGLARYDATWSPRSFGDNLTAWGMPVLLIESGGVPPGVPLEELTRLDFVALGVTLAELAADDLAARDPAVYDALPENNVDLWSDVVLRGGEIQQPAVALPYRADLAFDLEQGDRELAGCLPASARRTARSEVTELGDARVFGAGREIDARGLRLVPSFAVGIAEWRARRWLDGATLDLLARLGVARVVWRVPLGRVGAAEQRARALAGSGRPRVDVTSDRAELPRIVLRRAPALPAGRELAARLAALAEAGDARAPREPGERLAALWGDAPRPLRFEGPASFLVVRPAAEDGEVTRAAVASVFLDGVELVEPTR